MKYPFKRTMTVCMALVMLVCLVSVLLISSAPVNAAVVGPVNLNAFNAKGEACSPGFENGWSGWNPPSSGVAWGAYEDAIKTTAASQGFDIGNYGVKITSGTIYREFSITPGKWYEFSVDYYNVSGSARFKLINIKDSGNITSTGTWTRYTHRFFADANTTSVRVEMTIGGATPWETYVDNVALFAFPERINATFEDTTPGYLPNYWQFTAHGAGVSGHVVNMDGRADAAGATGNAMMIQDTSSANGGFETYFTAVPGFTYELSLKANVVPRSDIPCYVQFYDASGNQLTSTNQGSTRVGSNTPGWETITGSFVAPQGASYGRLWILTMTGDTPTVYIDDVTIAGLCSNHTSTGSATCTDAKVCDNCGYEMEPATGHAFNTLASNQQATPASCAGAATYYVKCDHCDEISSTKTVAVGTANPHSFNTEASNQQATPADCTKAATYYVKCDNCTAISDTKTVSVGSPSTEHAFNTLASNQQATPASCAGAATYYVKCDHCDEISSTKTVPVGSPDPHAFNNEASNQQATPADCTKAATYYVKCDNCTAISDTKTVSVGAPSTEHAFNTLASNQQATPADCTKAATYYVKCDHCDEISDDKTVAVGNPKAHDLTAVPAKPASVDEKGNKAYWICEECEKWFADAEGTTEITDKTSVEIPKLTPPAKPDVPETGDEAALVLMTTLLVLSCALTMAFVLNKRRV